MARNFHSSEKPMRVEWEIPTYDRCRRRAWFFRFETTNNQIEFYQLPWFRTWAGSNLIYSRALHLFHFYSKITFPIYTVPTTQSIHPFGPVNTHMCTGGRRNLTRVRWNKGPRRWSVKGYFAPKKPINFTSIIQQHIPLLQWAV